jgi:TolB protein
MRSRPFYWAFLCGALGSAIVATSASAQTLPDGLAATVERFARVGSAGNPDFSPDGKWVSLVTNLSGTPQVWVVPSEGGYPRMVTNGNDPVTQAQWSPKSDVIAVSIAPGGGMNTQVYLVKADGTGWRRLTQGGKDNNGIDAWSDDGTRLYIDSSRRSGNTRCLRQRCG